MAMEKSPVHLQQCQNKEKLKTTEWQKKKQRNFLGRFSLSDHIQ
jgi:hypothetical protein